MPPKGKKQAKHHPVKDENDSPVPVAAPSATRLMGPTDYTTQQQEELEILRAIYAEDFEQVHGRAAWNVSSPS